MGQLESLAGVCQKKVKKHFILANLPSYQVTDDDGRNYNVSIDIDTPIKARFSFMLKKGFLSHSILGSRIYQAKIAKPVNGKVWAEGSITSSGSAMSGESFMGSSRIVGDAMTVEKLNSANLNYAQFFSSNGFGGGKYIQIKPYFQITPQDSGSLLTSYFAIYNYGISQVDPDRFEEFVFLVSRLETIL